MPKCSGLLDPQTKIVLAGSSQLEKWVDLPKIEFLLRYHERGTIKGRSKADRHTVSHQLY